MEFFVRPIARGERIFRLSLIFLFYRVQSGRKRKEFTLMNQIRRILQSVRSYRKRKGEAEFSLIPFTDWKGSVSFFLS